VGRRLFAVPGSHDFARHRHTERFADGEGAGAWGVKTVDPRRWFSRVVGKGEVCRGVGTKCRGQKVQE